MELMMITATTPAGIRITPRHLLHLDPEYSTGPDYPHISATQIAMCLIFSVNRATHSEVSNRCLHNTLLHIVKFNLVYMHKLSTKSFGLLWRSWHRDAMQAFARRSVVLEEGSFKPTRLLAKPFTGGRSILKLTRVEVYNVDSAFIGFKL